MMFGQLLNIHRSKGSDQADLRLCWWHIPHCWKSHVAAHIESLLHNIEEHISTVFFFAGLTMDIKGR